MRVGHCRPGAASAVARRARQCARTFRADLQHAGRIDPRQGTAAGADLDQVDHRTLDRVTTDVHSIDEAVGVELRTQLRFAVDHNTRLRRSPPHIECNQIAKVLS